MLETIRQDVQSVLDRDPAARNPLEVLLCYPGLHARIFHRLTNTLWHMGLKWLARFISHLARWRHGGHGGGEGRLAFEFAVELSKRHRVVLLYPGGVPDMLPEGAADTFCCTRVRKVAIKCSGTS